jgi:hypothetical protein
MEVSTKEIANAESLALLFATVAPGVQESRFVLIAALIPLLTTKCFDVIVPLSFIQEFSYRSSRHVTESSSSSAR